MPKKPASHRQARAKRPPSRTHAIAEADRGLKRHPAADEIRKAVKAFLKDYRKSAIGEPVVDVTAQRALHGHAIDEHAEMVLTRLSEAGRPSDRLTAAEAIVRAVPRGRWGIVFADCILAERRARSHKDWLTDARKNYTQSTDIIGKFKPVARFIQRQYPHSPPADETLKVMGLLLSMCQRSAADHIALYSRKTTTDAARQEGLSWLKDSLSVTSQQAEPRHLAAIATAALGMGEVTVDAARKAVAWRERLDAQRQRRRIRSKKTV